MNREIKFRGLSLSGEWHTGNLAVTIGYFGGVKTGSYISNRAGRPFAYAVRPDSIRQYTGLKDRNGIEIYEGDLVRYTVPSLEDGTPCGDPNIPTDDMEYTEAVEYESGGFVIEGYPLYVAIDFNCEVIGNIHQNN